VGTGLVLGFMRALLSGKRKYLKDILMGVTLDIEKPELFFK